VKQSWSGGIAGRAGENYFFSLLCKNCIQQLQPDTIWIGRQPVALNKTSTLQKTTDKGIVLEISASISKDQNIFNNPADAALPHLAKPPYDYKGVALFCYRYNGARRYLEIKKIMKIFPSASYP
jgi:hypothetical protein